MSPKQSFIYWVIEREQARMRKELIGGPGPHSADPIIGRCRFCNVNREHDAVTRWVATNIRNPLGRCPSVLVPQLLMARIFNEPATLQHLPVLDRPTAAVKALNKLRAMRAEGFKIMRGAYMMPVHGNQGGGKHVEDYYMAAVAEAMRVEWANPNFQPLAAVAERLCQLKGIGEFLANQVCADLRYTPYWAQAPDWGTFVLCGPGSRRGLDRYNGGLPGNKGFGSNRQEHYATVLLGIRSYDLPDVLGPGILKHFSDPNNLSNCFCEFDKFERARRGEATLKKYV